MQQRTYQRAHIDDQEGIPILVIVASLLDPRTKGGVGIPQTDKELAYAKVKEAMILIAQQLGLQVAPNNNNNNNADDDDEMIYNLRQLIVKKMIWMQCSKS